MRSSRGQPQGPLCGPSSAPCRVLIDEQIPTTPALRDEMPALVLMPKCTPWILFSAKQDGAYNGFEALRDTDGQWSVHETPFDFATAGLVLSKSGSLFALPNDGAYGTSLWGFAADGWVKMNDVPAPVALVASGVAIGNEETIYAGFRTDQSEVMLGSFNGTWLLSKLGDSVDFPTIGLSPKSEPQVAWTQHKDVLDVNRIFWQAPPLNSQVACASLGMTSYGIRRTQLAVTAADAANPRGKPHLFVYERIIGLPAQSHSLNYVTYAYSSDIGSNAWIDVPVASSSTYFLVPLGMIHDDTGDIRFFYAIYDAVTGIPEVRIAWKEADGMKSAVVLSGKEVREASFALDGAGNVHIAMYVLAEGGTHNVQYLVLGI